MKKSDKIEEKINSKVEPKKENNSSLYALTIILLVVTIYCILTLKQHDFENKYSAICSEKLVNEYWEQYSWVNFYTNFSRDNDFYWFYWDYKVKWSKQSIECVFDENDNADIRFE